MILLDTSGLLAALDSSQRLHTPCAAALAGAARPRLLSPFVLAELDHLIASRVGSRAQLALLEEVSSSVYQLVTFDGQDVASAHRVIQDFADLGISLADASLVILAGRYGVRDVLTLDTRHFRALRRPNGRPFRLLPADR